MDLADVLDELSFRSSKAAQLAALQHIHSILADVCVRLHDPGQRTHFLTLQNDFETNIASRILSSGIVSASVVPRAVDEIRAKASTSSTVVDVTSLALSILQGMALIHARSKIYMGRRLGIQTLLDLLTALRHASANPDDPDTTVMSGMDAPDVGLTASLSSLACSVIDTLLCLLVDSPKALRVFEECNGLEVIVRTLKKIIGQNVRMKCLEFLYFYLQDEDVLAVTGVHANPTPAPVNPKSPPAAQGTAKPTRVTNSKPSVPASQPRLSPSDGHALQTPRRPKLKQLPATDTRPRTRVPVDRTVSGDSTLSVLSSRSGATDTSARPDLAENDLDAEMRPTSRASTRSIASTRSNATDLSKKSGVNGSSKLWEPEANSERRFSRMPVMPSLSYSSSTISSTYTNQTLEQGQPSSSRLHPHTPSQTRPTTPSGLNQECYVPLPESPAKPGRQDMLDTPKPKRTKEKSGARARDGKGQDTPRAKVRSGDSREQAEETLPIPPPSSANLFPALGANLPQRSSPSPFAPLRDSTSKPARNSGTDNPFKPRPVAPALLTISLLQGEVDYEPVSPQKRTPSRTFGDAASKPTKEPTSNPFKESSSKSSKESPEPKEPTSPVKPVKHRPRASEILPRPTPVRPGPRNVSTPVTTPTTPNGTRPSTPSSGVASGTTTPSVLGTEASSISTVPANATTSAAATPGRSKKVAAIPGGTRVPGRSEAGSNDLRKSVFGGAKELKKSQSSNEGLRKSRESSEGLRKSQRSSEALRKSQASESDLRKEKQEALPRSKMSVPPMPVASKSQGGRKAVGDGRSRVKGDGVESEGRSNAEVDRYTITNAKRTSFEEPSPSRATRGVPPDGKIVRSSAEKKELLGAWLGNVDALVEGVQRAGVWGLR